MKIVDCIKLKERKDLRKKFSEKRKEERERRGEGRRTEESLNNKEDKDIRVAYRNTIGGSKDFPD